jgi:Leucine-rich repeat (LRR) protein
LILHDCGLRSLPDWLANLTSLETLSVGRNDLREVPPVITRLRSLRYLGLSSVQLSDIPQGSAPWSI